MEGKWIKNMAPSIEEQIDEIWLAIDNISRQLSTLREPAEPFDTWWYRHRLEELQKENHALHKKAASAWQNERWATEGLVNTKEALSHLTHAVRQYREEPWGPNTFMLQRCLEQADRVLYTDEGGEQ